MAVSCQHLWGAVCGREKVGNIFSFGVPWKIAVEMRLCFMAVIQAQNAGDRRDREEETGSGQQKQDSCNCSMTDAGETMTIKLKCEDSFFFLGKVWFLGSSDNHDQPGTMKRQRLWIIHGRASKVVQHSKESSKSKKEINLTTKQDRDISFTKAATCSPTPPKGSVRSSHPVTV